MFEALHLPAHARLSRPRLALVLDGTAAAIPAWLGRLEAQRLAHGLRPSEGGIGVLLLPRDRIAPAPLCPEGWPFALTLGAPASSWRDGMQAAADWVGPEGIVLTAQAERLPEPGWLAAHAEAMAAGAPVAVGHLRTEGHAWDYARLVAAIAARLDPGAQDGPPTGAAGTLALRAGLLRGAVPLQGPAALLDLLRARDVPVRQAAAVVTGQAAPPAPERLGAAWQRIAARAALRRLWESGAGSVAPETAALRGLARRLGLPAGRIGAELRARHFGRAWAAVEAASPHLAFDPLRPEALDAARRRARLLLGWLRLRPGPEA